MRNQFFITLASNVSNELFPNNTQSHFITKLPTPLNLEGSNWKCALTDIIFPKSWHNITEKNSKYQVTYPDEVDEPDIKEYDILISSNKYDTAFEAINRNILYTANTNIVNFDVNYETQDVTLNIPNGYEIRIEKDNAPLLLKLLSLIELNVVLTTTTKFKLNTNLKLRPGMKDVSEQYITLVDKRKLLEAKKIIPVKSIKENNNKDLKFFDVINDNINMVMIKGVVRFSLDESERYVTVIVSPGFEVIIDKDNCATFAALLSLKRNVTILTGTSFHFYAGSTVNIDSGDYFEIRKTMLRTKVMKTQNFSLPQGLYSNGKQLSKYLDKIKIDVLKNDTVKLTVPDDHELLLSREFADILGFEEMKFGVGEHVAQYRLQLEAGISEVFVYTDLISSQIVGNTMAPLLKIIPVLKEKEGDQVVRSYSNPLYLDLQKNYIENVEVELRGSSGDYIHFTDGKIFLVLSFVQI